MKSVTDIAKEIVAREGGFVNDPDDPGGATNYGVTIHTMRRLGLDLNSDGAVDIRDVRLLTLAQATDIFVRHYFEAPGLGTLPGSLQATVFDMQVNAGSNAVKILQRCLSRMVWDVRDDGVLGPKTAKAAAEAARIAPDHITDIYGIARRNYYYALADARPASRKYARRRDGGKGGWIVRAEGYITAKYHLTLAAHRERTAKWD